MVGYPNVGKSSIINTLKKKKVCTIAPIPGETKVWQYISLMKRINMIDCPGIVPPNMNDTPEDILLRGVVRIENVEYPSHYIQALMGKVKRHHMERTYQLKGWEDYTGFLEMMARKGGRLLKGGEPDIEGVAKMVVHDFLRGKIPWFTPCPSSVEGAVNKARGGTLGEMPKKRKRDGADAEAEGAESVAAETEATEGESLLFDDEDLSDEESDEEAADEGEGEDEVEVADRISLGGDSSDEESDAEEEEEDEDSKVEEASAILSEGDASEDGGVPVATEKAAQGNKRRRK
ncbi:50S ribosome-binding GTPase [Candidatus Bathyarchaeota archaeon]|nr:50S ribosome-binding GTPase [Candidatus Bathyarchaeota archaeon]